MIYKSTNLASNFMHADNSSDINQRFPKVSEEDWKYTDLTHLVNKDFTFLSLDEVPFSYDDSVQKVIQANNKKILDLNPQTNIIIFLDGKFIKDFSKFNHFSSEQISIDGYIDTFKNDKESCLDEVPNLKARKTPKKNYGISNFINTVSSMQEVKNSACTNGVVVHVSDQDSANNIINIRIVFYYTRVSNNKIVNHKNRLDIASDRNVNLIEEYITLDKSTDGCTMAIGVSNLEEDFAIELNSNFLLEINLEDRANLTHYILQNCNQKHYNITTYLVTQKNKSIYNNYNLNFGAKLARQDIIVYQNGDYANTELFGLYMPQKSQHMDAHLKIFHNGSYGTSKQDYRGVLSDRAHGVWNGMVRVAHGTTANTAIQNNKNLSLSKFAQVDAKPELEIYSDDVSCSHGATIGTLDNKALFYLQSRGIPREEAKKMLIYGFIDYILNNIKNSEVTHWLSDKYETTN